jgi:hypothetical protein
MPSLQGKVLLLGHKLRAEPQALQGEDSPLSATVDPTQVDSAPRFVRTGLPLQMPSSGARAKKGSGSRYGREEDQEGRWIGGHSTLVLREPEDHLEAELQAPPEPHG